MSYLGFIAIMHNDIEMMLAEAAMDHDLTLELVDEMWRVGTLCSIPELYDLWSLWRDI